MHTSIQALGSGIWINAIDPVIDLNILCNKHFSVGIQLHLRELVELIFFQHIFHLNKLHSYFDQNCVVPLHHSYIFDVK